LSKAHVVRALLLYKFDTISVVKAKIGIFLAYCRGAIVASTIKSSTIVTPSLQFEVAINSLCTSNCNTTVPAENPSVRQDITISSLQAK
jgi:hypothetical protein